MRLRTSSYIEILGEDNLRSLRRNRTLRPTTTILDSF